MYKTLILYFFYFVAAMVFSLVTTPLVRSLAFRIGALDRGGKGRRIHKGVVPRLGGVAIVMSFAVPMLFSLGRGPWDSFHRQVAFVLLAAFFVLLIGVYDDLRNASILIRLLVETGAAVMVFSLGVRIEALSNPFSGGVIHLGWLSLPVTVLWIVLVTNAFNLIDGLDGLAAGTGILVSLTLVLVNFGRDVHINIVFAALIGSLAGFLFYNFPPASIFMGDSGSLFLGFFLGAFSITSSFKATAMATLMIPIIAFAIPLLDVAYAVMRRVYRGLPVSLADREHIHHKLLDKGLKRRSVLGIIYAMNIVAMLVVLAFVHQKMRIDFLLMIALVAAGILGMRLLGYLRFNDLFRESLRNLQMSRKRRYYNFLIRKFQQQVRKATSWYQFRPHLDELVMEYGFDYVEVHVDAAGGMNPIYTFGSKEERVRRLHLEFPVIKDNRAFGRVLLMKRMDDEQFLCTAELMRTMSENLARFVEMHIDRGTWYWLSEKKK